MKKTVIVALIGATSWSMSALSADMPPMPYKAVPVAAPFSWQGYYFGVHGGYGWGEHESLAVNFITLKPTGGFGGVQAGYNSMIAPNWLLGSEIQISGGDIKDSLPTVAASTRTKIDFFGTALVRLGYTFDRTLVYAAGGVAWAQNNTEDTGGNFRVNESHVGWTIGGGLEYAIDPRWSAKIEYLYADLGELHATSSGALTYNNPLLKLNTVKFGLNYRFADAASVAPLPVKAMPRAAYSWSGSYIGGNVGYTWGVAEVSDALGGGLTTSFRPRDWNAGAQTGYNWVFAPNLLLGFETDNSFLSPKDNLPGASVKITDAGTVRARLGYVNDRTLVYGTGGLAYAKTKFSDVPNNQFVRAYQIGWVAGGGMEYMFAPRWSAKLEYLYADYGRTDLVFTNLGDESRSSLKTQSVTVGLNYKFDLSEWVRR